MKIVPNGQPEFINYLKMQGWLKQTPPPSDIVERLNPEQVQNETVVVLGSIPLFMAEAAKMVISFPLRGARGGVPLSLAELSRKIGAPVAYKVTRVPVPLQVTILAE